MALNLSGKRAAVTGASKGIGRALAARLAIDGVDLDLTARNEEDLDTVATDLTKEFGVAVRSNPDDSPFLAKQAGGAKACAGADVLVKLAGAIPFGEIHVASDADWRTSQGLKVFGRNSLTRLFYCPIKVRRDGVIVNFIGMGGIRSDALNVEGCTGNTASGHDFAWLVRQLDYLLTN